MDFIFISLIVLVVIASFLMILAVLVQSPKSGMAANFGASNAVMGVRQTSNFLEKFTWSTALVIVVLSVLTTMFIPTENIEQSKSVLQQSLEQSQEQSNTFTIPETMEEEEVVVEQPATETKSTKE